MLNNDVFFPDFLEDLSFVNERNGLAYFRKEGVSFFHNGVEISYLFYSKSDHKKIDNLHLTNALCEWEIICFSIIVIKFLIGVRRNKFRFVVWIVWMKSYLSAFGNDQNANLKTAGPEIETAPPLT